jgi:hypothetical protein
MKIYKITTYRAIKGYEEPEAVQFVSVQFTRDEEMVKCLNGKYLRHDMFIECEEMWLEENENDR